MDGLRRWRSVELRGGPDGLVSDIALALDAIDKRFGSLAALTHASLVVRRGTLHAVLVIAKHFRNFGSATERLNDFMVFHMAILHTMFKLGATHHV